MNKEIMSIVGFALWLKIQMSDPDNGRCSFSFYAGGTPEDAEDVV